MNTPPVKQNQVKLGYGPENKKIDSTELRPLCMRGRMRVNSRILNMKLGHILQMLLASLKERGIFISKAHRYLSVEERQSLVYVF
ncbi:hypothetical protein WN944_028913 [Citrus x changshan-huyou]|uniref:Uncharacterized protein n=1 Tax=Citrus x changshan-huyou TaxID=2935761 RepID=A0AAP0LRM3_9ROSI